MKYEFLYKIPSIINENDYHHYENIVNCASHIVKKLTKYDDVVCVAEMQSGKTDVMKRIIYLVNKYNNRIRDLNINIDKYNIYLIICASSINLKNQLKDKLPEISQRIYHLNDISTFIKKSFDFDYLFVSMSDSSLIIFDESHCDAEQNKLIDKFRNKIDWIAKNNNTTYNRIYFSATPYAQISAGFSKVIMKPAPHYYGIRDMFDKINDGFPVVFQAKNLTDKDECHDLFTEIDICNFYYIFRLPNKKVNADCAMINIEHEFRKKKIRFDTYIYDMNYHSNINNLLNTKPSKPIVIYLKDKLRMGETLNTEFVYLVHDDPNNMHTHTTAQSLIGRCCGYYKKSHRTLIYCDFDKAWQHYQWISHGYDLEYLPTNAKYINKKNRGTNKICIY